MSPPSMRFDIFRQDGLWTVYTTSILVLCHRQADVHLVHHQESICVVEVVGRVEWGM